MKKRFFQQTDRNMDIINAAQKDPVCEQACSHESEHTDGPVRAQSGELLLRG